MRVNYITKLGWRQGLAIPSLRAPPAATARLGAGPMLVSRRRARQQPGIAHARPAPIAVVTPSYLATPEHNIILPMISSHFD